MAENWPPKFDEGLSPKQKAGRTTRKEALDIILRDKPSRIGRYVKFAMLAATGLWCLCACGSILGGSLLALVVVTVAYFVLVGVLAVVWFSTKRD